MIPRGELEELERVRGVTLDLIEELSQENLDRQPRAGGWSVGEVVDHLLKAEAANRREIADLIGLSRSGRDPYLRRDLTPGSLAPACMPRALLPLFSLPASFATQLIPASIRDLLIRHRLFPARAAEELQPRHGRLAGELRADLASSVRETRTLLADNHDLDYRRMIYQHPLLGTNDVHGILRLTAAHEQRHQDQISPKTSALRAVRAQRRRSGLKVDHRRPASAAKTFVSALRGGLAPYFPFQTQQGGSLRR